MVIARWTLASLLFFVFGWATLGNLIGIARATATNAFSMAPFIGGIFCTAGLLVIPSRLSAWWWLLPFVDPGTTILLPVLILGAWKLNKRK
jgi:hypothetical protein